MKVVFVSNSFNHHQKPFSDSMYKLLGNDYTFVETSTIPEFRKKLGYSSYEADYKISFDEYTKKTPYIKNLMDEADVVIYGSAPYDLIKKRVKQNKLVFRYSERIFIAASKPLIAPDSRYITDGPSWARIVSPENFPKSFGQYSKRFEKVP